MDIYEIRKTNLLALIGKQRKNTCADKWGMSAAHLSQILSDKTDKNLGDEVARRIEEREGLSFGWMDAQHSNEGESPRTDSRAGNNHADEVEPGPPILSAPRRVEIVGTAQLGDDGFWERVENGVDGWVETWTKDPDAYALRLKGDSMSPAIRSGWIAVCEPNHRRVPGEYVMVTLKDGRSMVKELTFDRDDEVVLSSINAEYERRTYSRDEIEKIHYVGNIMAPSKVMCRL